MWRRKGLDADGVPGTSQPRHRFAAREIHEGIRPDHAAELALQSAGGRGADAERDERADVGQDGGLKACVQLLQKLVGHHEVQSGFTGFAEDGLERGDDEGVELVHIERERGPLFPIKAKRVHGAQL